MPKKSTKRRLNKIAIPILFLVVGLLIWEAIVLIYEIPEYLLPKPSWVIFEIIDNLKSLLANLGITMAEAVSGFIIANILGFITAVIFVHSKTIENGFYPYVLALKTTPVIAIAPFLILWFGIGIKSKIATVVLVCFFPILVNAIKGLKAVDDDDFDLFKSLSATKWQIFTKLRLPNSLPFIFPALKTSTVLAVIGALVGEFIGANKGIGYLIVVTTQTFKTAETFAAIIMVALGGILFFSLISLIEKKVLFFQRTEEL
jgi:NitT/TauT family transport system permease protein